MDAQELFRKGDRHLNEKILQGWLTSKRGGDTRCKLFILSVFKTQFLRPLRLLHKNSIQELACLPQRFLSQYPNFRSVLANEVVCSVVLLIAVLSLFICEFDSFDVGLDVNLKSVLNLKRESFSPYPLAH